jgi:hypothetical protein
MKASLSINFAENTPVGTEGYAEVFSPDKPIILSEYSIDTPEGVAASVKAELCDGRIVELKSQDESSKGTYTVEEPKCVRRLRLVGVTKKMLTEARVVKFDIKYEVKAIISIESSPPGARVYIDGEPAIVYMMSEKR